MIIKKINTYCYQLILILLFLLLVVISGHTQASSGQLISVTTEGQFISKKHDRNSLVDKHLFNDAIKQAILQTLNKMHLESDKFWEKYILRFQESYNEKRNSYKKYVNKRFKNYPDEQKRTLIKRYLREHKLTESSQFFSKFFSNLVISYSIKDKSSSIKNPKHKFIKISSTLNSNRLNEIYNKLMDLKILRKGTHLVITPRYNLLNLTWEDLGTYDSKLITSPLKEHWIKDLKEKFKGNIESIHHLRDYRHSLETYVSSNKTDMGQIQDELLEQNKDQNDLNQDILKQSLWVKININIKSVRKNKILNTHEILLSGHLVVFDLLSKKLIYIQNIGEQKVKYHLENSDPHQTISTFAGYIYRIPQEFFSPMIEKIHKAPVSYSEQKITVMGNRNLKDIFVLKDQITLKGTAIFVKTSLYSYTKDKVVLLISYQGAPRKLHALLAELNTTMINGRKVSFSEKNNDWHIDFKEDKNVNNLIGPSNFNQDQDKSHI